jgi:hypothetical protein
MTLGRGGEPFKSGPAHALFATQVSPSNTQFRYDVARDGKRFLMMVPPSGVASEPATVLVNWQSALKK